MNNLNTPEISLRRAVILAGNQNPEAIKSSAFEHLELISQAQGFSRSISSQLDLHKESIALAIQGINLAYQAWSTHALKSSLARQKFVEETQTHLSTFVLDFQREINDFSREQQAIYHFWQSIQTEAASLIPYFGIQTQCATEQNKITHLAILPYFKMSLALPQKHLMTTLLEQHQQAIYLFLKTNLPNRDYVRSYQQTPRLKLKLESLWTKTNYLNRFRAPLFVIHSLANLLWSLQHPFDTTGLALSIHENINLCVKAELFINLLLDDFANSKLAKIDSPKHTLKTYFLNIERLIKSLHTGYQDQCLNHINLEDVSTSMHRASHIMANKLCELLYQNPDAAESFCAKILYLAEIIMQQPQILKNLWPQTEFPSIPGLNPKPTTLMDAIILLAHTEASQRQKLYRRIHHETHEIYQELLDVLQKLETEFLQPFETLLQHQHPKTHPKMRQQWFARYFVAFAALIMSCFTIFRDTRANPSETGILSDHEQRKVIMDIAASKEDDRYYRWSMALFLKTRSGNARDKIDALLTELNHMRMMTELLDKLASMVLENKILLLDKDFQRSLIDTLKKIRDAYRQLNTRLNRIEDAMNQDEYIQRSEKRILQPMLDDVEMTLESIQKSISQVAEVINHPMFNDKQQQAIMRQMQDIQAQFERIFSVPMKMPNLGLMRMQNLSLDEPRNLNTEKLACLKLIEICYQDLSTLSKYHSKGQTLLQLKRKVLEQTTYYKKDLEQDLLKLIALCASPRSSYFFQASYGQTRSAKALIRTLLDPEFQFSQQFIGIIFAKSEVNTKKISEQELIHRFQKLQQENQWPSIAPELA